ncbi:STAS domain-containing protein [Uliginosibacterium sediminicola]|uniref:STAS domain-containing protein n=1 Tax=Uliginosibacterium sediminicola TaxID=2024550 RepID=A0ABU9Z207_9RHOO
MSDFEHTQTEPGHLALAGDMNIFAAHAMKDVLLDNLNATDILKLDLSGVTEIDTTGIQLLLLLQKEAERRDKQVHVLALSPAVQQVVSLLKLEASLGHVSIVWS